MLRGTVSDMAARVLALLDGEDDGGRVWPAPVADSEHRHESFPLTKIQHAYLVGCRTSYDLGSTSIDPYIERL